MQIVDHSIIRKIYRLECNGFGVVMNDAIDYPHHQTLYCNLRDLRWDQPGYVVGEDYAVDRIYYEKFVCDHSDDEYGEKLNRCINDLHKLKYLYGWATLDLMRWFVVKDLEKVHDPVYKFMLWEITVKPGEYLVAPDGQVVFSTFLNNRVQIPVNIL